MPKRKMSTFERLQKGQLKRNERRDLGRRIDKGDPGLTVVNPDTAGIDVGNESHFTAVPPDRDANPVQEFGSWTDALTQMVTWLKQCRIRTNALSTLAPVVMQATGVYWIALEKMLLEAGFEVAVVNARGTKNLPGRKSDVQECEWLRKLHTYGLLRASFRLDETIEAVRTVWRQRERVVKNAGESVQQMQKALTKMNVQLHNAISDLSGVTGMAILRAIVGGERDAMKLAQLRHRSIQASEEEIARSLEGHWRTDTLWELKEVLDAYDFHQRQLTACDEKLKEYIGQLPSKGAPEDKTETPALSAKDARKRRKKQLHKSKNQPVFELREELVRVTGADLTAIDGISVMTAQTFFSEVGADLSAFPTEGHFCSWLQLTPKRDVSGGKVIRHAKSPVQSRVAVALRMGAESLWHSDSYLGARYRQLKARRGGLKATKGMARYLACLIYRLLKNGQEWVDRGAAYYEAKRKERELRALERKAAALGVKIVIAA